MKEKIEKWYKQGLWTKEMVYDAIGKLLTEDEAYSIVNNI